MQSTLLYQSLFEQTQIEQLNSQLGRMSTDIQSNIQKVNKSVNKANFQIKDKKKEYAELIKNFEHYQDSLQGAEQMIDDYKTLYNKFQKLSHKIESIINNTEIITDKILDDIITEYDILQNDNQYTYLSFYKTKITN